MSLNKNLHKALINNGLSHGVAVLLADPAQMQGKPRKAKAVEDPAEKTTVAELRETIVELQESLRDAGLLAR